MKGEIWIFENNQNTIKVNNLLYIAWRSSSVSDFIIIQ